VVRRVRGRDEDASFHAPADVAGSVDGEVAILHLASVRADLLAFLDVPGGRVAHGAPIIWLTRMVFPPCRWTRSRTRPFPGPSHLLRPLEARRRRERDALKRRPRDVLTGAAECQERDRHAQASRPHEREVPDATRRRVDEEQTARARVAAGGGLVEPLVRLAH